MSLSNAPDSPAPPTARFAARGLLLLAALGALLLTQPACEDEVVESSGPRPNAAPKPAAPAGGAPARAGGARPAPGGGQDEATPSIEDIAARRSADLEGKVPEASAEAVIASLRVRNPLALARIVGPLAGTPVDAEGLSSHLADLYGFDTLDGLSLDQPAAVFWLDGSDVPVVVVSVKHAGEVMSALPEPIVDRKGNAFSFSFGVTRTAYLNFFGPADSMMAVTGDYRHWPQAGEHIVEVVASDFPADVLAAGRADLARLADLKRWLDQAPAPMPGLEPGWSSTRNDLGVLLGSTSTAELEVRSEDAVHRVSLHLTPATEQGGLRTLVRDAEPADPNALFARLPDAVTADARAWLWQDLRHAPLDLDAVPGALISPFVGLEPDAGLTAVLDAELARSKALAGPTLTVQHGHGDEERLAVVAPIEDRAAFDTASSARLTAIDAYAGAERIESLDALPDEEDDEDRGDDPPATASWPADAVALQVVLGDAETPPLFGLEWTRDPGELVGFARRGEGELTIPSPRTGGTPPATLATARALSAEAKPLLLWVADLAQTVEEQGEPVMLGVFATGEQLDIELSVPQPQLTRLRR